MVLSPGAAGGLTSITPLSPKSLTTGDFQVHEAASHGATAAPPQGL